MPRTRPPYPREQIVALVRAGRTPEELALSRLDTVYQRHLALGLNLSGVSTDLPAEVGGRSGE
jgi:hypothetical protein